MKGKILNSESQKIREKNQRIKIIFKLKVKKYDEGNFFCWKEFKSNCIF